ncbi:MAG: type II secretion system protein [Planctomycetes bacterium]|nr:type II secretion system protein [Planctomycetota bacterium]
MNMRKGFTLIEMSAILTVIGVLMVFGVTMIMGTMRTHTADAELFDRVYLQSALAELFRDDVASAEAAPAQAGDFAADGQCLILRHPESGLIVYRVAADRLVRLEKGAGKELEQTYRLDKDQASVEFQRSGKDNRLITLRLTEHHDDDRVRRVIEFSAALGGNLK